MIKEKAREALTHQKKQLYALDLKLSREKLVNKTKNLQGYLSDNLNELACYLISPRSKQQSNGSVENGIQKRVNGKQPRYGQSLKKRSQIHINERP